MGLEDELNKKKPGSKLGIVVAASSIVVGGLTFYFDPLTSFLGENTEFINDVAGAGLMGIGLTYLGYRVYKSLFRKKDGEDRKY